MCVCLLYIKMIIYVYVCENVCVYVCVFLVTFLVNKTNRVNFYNKITTKWEVFVPWYEVSPLTQ